MSLEVPQGFSLGLNQQFFPYSTSRECSVMAGLNDACINPYYLGKVSMSIRTFPIRVGNIHDEHGDVIGWSGPHYDDQNELTWEEVGVEPEVTTVTKRVRRVFTFSMQQFEDAVKANRPDIIFLNFMNYLPEQEGADLAVNLHQRWDFLMNSELGKLWTPSMGSGEWLYGFGPCVEDVYETYLNRTEWNEKEKA